jgi:hypothetical protein
MSRQIILTVEIIEPYSVETLNAFGIQAGTAEEYAFCLGWQDGATNHLTPLAPVTESQVVNYQSGWALGSLNRIVWLVQSARATAQTE